MNVSCDKKDAMTFLRCLSEIRPEGTCSAGDPRSCDHVCGVRTPVPAR